MGKKLDFRKATLSQLYEILYNDQEAPHWAKAASSEELKRRQQQKHTRVNYREKAVYPR